MTRSPLPLVLTLFGTLSSPVASQEIPGVRDLLNRMAEEVHKASLVGIEGMGVQVYRKGNALPGLEETTLEAAVELRMRQSGIKVLDAGEVMAAPGSPSLNLELMDLEAQSVSGTIGGDTRPTTSRRS